MTTYNSTLTAPDGGTDGNGNGLNANPAIGATFTGDSVGAAGHYTGGHGGNGANRADAGGSAGQAGGGGAVGGYGAAVSSGTLQNNGVLIGGAGGNGGDGGSSASTPGAGGSGGFGGFGILIYSGANLLNHGTVLGGVGGNGGDGGQLDGSGDLTGAAGTGFVGGDGVFLFDASTVTNTGSITGGDAGIPGNSASGSGNQGFSDGGSGIFFGGAGGYVINSGTITGGNSHSQDVNAQAGWGVYYTQGGTLTNSGTISAGIEPNGVRVEAARFEGGAGHVILEGNPVFIGDVLSDSSYANTIELAVGNGPGSISGLDTFYGFGSLAVDAGATWTLAGTTTVDYSMAITNNGTIVEYAGDNLTINSDISGTGVIRLDGGTVTINGFVDYNTQTVDLAGSGDTLVIDGNYFYGNITNFDSSDSIKVTGLGTITGVDYDGSYLVVHGQLGDSYLALDNTGLTPGHFSVSSDGTVHTDAVACFCPGTLISTPAGSAAVESLSIGDEVLTQDGKTTKLKWIGRQTRNPIFAALNDELPICITQGALGNGLPLRDLYLSPDHAMLVQGCLVHAGALVNGRSITRMSKWQGGDVKYFHIETEAHEIILAEGAAAETFMDKDARHRFDNHAEFAALYPDAAPMTELDLPRISYARQLPRAISRVLEGVADEIVGKLAAAA